MSQGLWLASRIQSNSPLEPPEQKCSSAVPDEICVGLLTCKVIKFVLFKPQTQQFEQHKFILQHQQETTTPPIHIIDYYRLNVCVPPKGMLNPDAQGDDLEVELLGGDGLGYQSGEPL